MQENGKLTVLNMQDILPNRFQPRIRFDEEKLEELALSIGKYGVIQPIVVRPVGNKFEIIAGERRFKASRLANRSTIPAIVINLSDKDSEEIALLENVQRQQLNPIEEAVSYKRILDMGYINQEQLAKKIGKSQSSIVNKIRLLNLDDEVQSYLLNNKISERHARSLLRISNKDKQVSMLHRIVEERLTVKQTDREVAKLKELDNDSFKKTSEDINQSKVVNETDIVDNQRFNSIKSQENEVVSFEKENVPRVAAPIETEEIESLFEDSVKEERGNHMDIDKIMREAKDINVSQPLEKKDISNLMVPGNETQSEPISTNNDVSVENGKFISVQPQVQEKTVTTPIQNNGVTFDSVFNQGLDFQSTPVSQPNVITNNENLNQNVISNVVTSDENVISNMPVQSANGIQNNINTPVISQTEVNQNLTASSIEISKEAKDKISNAVAIALKRYSSEKQVKNEIPAQKLDNQESSSNTPVSNNIPDMDIISDNSFDDYMKPKVDDLVSDVKHDVSPAPEQANFAKIVKMLRDCADKIEENGYFVNVDELDLGSQYKVTFTIDKE